MSTNHPHDGRQTLADRIRSMNPHIAKPAVIQHILAAAIWCVPSAIETDLESLARLVEGQDEFELSCECLQAIRCVLDMDTVDGTQPMAVSLEEAIACATASWPYELTDAPIWFC